MSDKNLDTIFNDAIKDSLKEVEVDNVQEPKQFEHRIIIAEKNISVKHIITRFLSLFPQIKICVPYKSYAVKINEREYNYIPKYEINPAEQPMWDYQNNRRIHFLFTIKRMSILNLYNMLQFLQYLEKYFRFIVVEFDDIRYDNVYDIMRIDKHTGRFGYSRYKAGSEYIKKLNVAEYLYMGYREKMEQAILNVEFKDEQFDIYEDCSKYYGLSLKNVETTYIEHNLYGNDINSIYIFRYPFDLKTLVDEYYQANSKVIYGNIYKSETKICVLFLLEEDLEILKIRWMAINFYLDHQFLGEISYREYMNLFFKEDSEQ